MTESHILKFGAILYIGLIIATFMLFGWWGVFGLFMILGIIFSD